MLDPLYIRCTAVAEIPSDISSTSSIASSARYNPLETLGKDEGTPSSFYQIQSAIRTFSLVHVCRGVTIPKFAFADLSDNDGCLMAIQGLYPNSIQYSLTKPIRAEARIDIGKVKMEATSAAGFARICRSDNPRGVFLAYCSPGNGSEETVHRVVAGVACVSSVGTLLIEVEDYKSTLFANLWTFLAARFGSIVLYKPGTLSCVSRGALLVCQGKGLAFTSEPAETQISTLETYRYAALQSVSQGVDNLRSFDNAAYIWAYIKR